MQNAMERRVTRHQKTLKKYRRRQIYLYGSLILALLGLSYLFVWQRVYTLQLGDNYSAHKRAVSELKERCRSLEYTIDELASIAHVEQFARQELALAPRGETTHTAAIVTLSKKPNQTAIIAVKSVASSKAKSKTSKGSKRN